MNQLSTEKFELLKAKIMRSQVATDDPYVARYAIGKWTVTISSIKHEVVIDAGRVNFCSSAIRYELTPEQEKELSILWDRKKTEMLDSFLEETSPWLKVSTNLDDLRVGDIFVAEIPGRLLARRLETKQDIDDIIETRDSYKTMMIIKKEGQ